MNGADLLVGELVARGVPFVPVLCGNGLDPFLVSASKADLRVVDTRNEQAASYIADSYARLTGRVGVCAVSSGIAHVNALAGVLNAWYDGAPLVLITGASPSAMLGRGAFQDVDQLALARPICKRVELVTRSERIPLAVHEAFAAATSGRPGPAHLTIPVDVLSAEVAAHEAKRPFSTLGEARGRAAGDAQRIRQTARILAGAKRPLIVAGSGAFYAGAGEALQRFAKISGIPVVTPIWDRGVIDAPASEFLGVIGAAGGEPQLLEDVDLILMLGARVDYRLRYLDSPPMAEGVRVIRVEMDPNELYQGTEPDVAITADPRTALEQLATAWEEIAAGVHTSWLEEARRRHQAFYGQWSVSPKRESGPMTGGQLIDALRPVLTDDALFLIDGGNIGQWVHMKMCNGRYPGHWLTCGASGVVGWGVPGAMAARLTFPDRPVLLLSGDGAIGFGIAEFESAARQGIPFVAVLADDSAWGIVVSGQRRTCGATMASEIGPADYAAVARAFGARGVRVEKPDEVALAVEDGFRSGAPTLIQVPIRVGGPAD